VSLSLEQLKEDVASGKIDTVVVGATDMQGRMQGKRIHAPFFIADTIKNGTEGCNYLLAVDIDMNTVQGYDVSSWDTGYADMGMAPDCATCLGTKALQWLWPTLSTTTSTGFQFLRAPS